jgi:integrase-like protein
VERARLAPLRIHDLRHTAVALAVAAGAHPKEIQELCGHASITTTLNVYGHLFEASSNDSPSAWTRRSAPLVPPICPPKRPRTSSRYVAELEKGPLSRRFRSGAGRTRTSDRRIMSPLL